MFHLLSETKRHDRIPASTGGNWKPPSSRALMAELGGKVAEETRGQNRTETQRRLLIQIILKDETVLTHTYTHIHPLPPSPPSHPEKNKQKLENDIGRKKVTDHLQNKHLLSPSTRNVQYYTLTLCHLLCLIWPHNKGTMCVLNAAMLLFHIPCKGNRDQPFSIPVPPQTQNGKALSHATFIPHCACCNVNCLHNRCLAYMGVNWLILVFIKNIKNFVSDLVWKVIWWSTDIWWWEG